MKTYATILRNSVADCSNFGISSQETSIWVVNPVDMTGDMLHNFYKEVGNFLVVCTNVLGNGVHLKPYVEMQIGHHQMNGGNFAYSSCSSFEEVTGSDAPVAIFDRIERA